MSGTKNRPKGRAAAPKGGGSRGLGPPPSKADARAERQRAAEAAAGGVAVKASPGEMPRLQQLYRDEVRRKLQQEFGYKNPMQVPKLDKIVINMGVGEATQDQKKLQAALSKVVLHAGYGTISLDKNRNAIQDQFVQQLYLDNGQLAIRTIAYVPKVDQTFGGTFSPSTPPPGRTYPPCVKRNIPWAGKEKAVVNGIVTNKVITKLP